MRPSVDGVGLSAKLESAEMLVVTTATMVSGVDVLLCGDDAVFGMARGG